MHKHISAYETSKITFVDAMTAWWHTCKHTSDHELQKYVLMIGTVDYFEIEKEVCVFLCSAKWSHSFSCKSVTHQSLCCFPKWYLTPLRHSSFICVELTQWRIIRRQQTILCTPVTLVKKHYTKGRLGRACLYAWQMGYAAPLEKRHTCHTQ